MIADALEELQRAINSLRRDLDYLRQKGTGTITSVVVASHTHASHTGIGTDDHHASFTSADHSAIGNSAPHHAQQHAITSSADHTVTASQYQLVGATGANTLGLLTPSADVSAGTTAILRSNAGALGLQTLNFGADVSLNRYGADELGFAAGDGFRVADYAIDSDGYRVTGAGHGYFRYLYATEFHAKSFIADLEQALAGGQIITKSVAPLAEDFTCPAAGATANLIVQEFQGFGSFHVFVDGDVVRLRSFSRAGSSLTIGDCWGTVVYDSRDATNQTQTYVFTRSTGGDAGSLSAATVIGKGTLALDYGTTGNGYVETVAQSGAMASGVPYQQIVTWATHPATGQTVRTRIGNLNGVYGIASDYFGIGLGDYAGGNYLRYETNGGFLLKAGGGVVAIDSTGVGVDAAAVTWANPNAYKFMSGSTPIGGTFFYRNSPLNAASCRAMLLNANDTVQADLSAWTGAGQTLGAIHAYVQVFADSANAANSVVTLNVNASQIVNVSPSGATITALNVGSATGAGTGDVTISAWFEAANTKGLSIRNAANSAYRSVVTLNGSNSLIIGVDTDIASVQIGDTAARLTVNSTGTTIAGALDHDGASAGFYGIAPVARQTLATGAGRTVDDVITALQNLGLVKQS